MYIYPTSILAIEIRVTRNTRLGASLAACALSVGRRIADRARNIVAVTLAKGLIKHEGNGNG